MTAADILRERSDGLLAGADYQAPLTRDEWRERAAFMRAVADLMERVCAPYGKHPGGFICLACHAGGKPSSKHDSDCPLAALERLIEG